MMENIIISAGVFCCGCLGGCCLASCLQPPRESSEDLEEENNMLRNFIYDMTPRRWRAFTRVNSGVNTRRDIERTPEVTPRVVVQPTAPSCDIVHADAEYIDEPVEINRNVHVIDRN